MSGPAGGGRFGHVEFEMPIGHLGGGAQRAVGGARPEFRPRYGRVWGMVARR